MSQPKNMQPKNSNRSENRLSFFSIAANRKRRGLCSASLEEKYGVPVIAVNAEALGEDEIMQIMQKVLFEFPVVGVDVRIPKWIQYLPETSKTVSAILAKLKKIAPSLIRMKDCLLLEKLFCDEDKFLNPDNISMELGKGRAEIRHRGKRRSLLRGTERRMRREYL